jgi:DNA-binding response OmpR family regulator
VVRIAFVADRSPAEVLPAVESSGHDVKVEPFGPLLVASIGELAPAFVFVDCASEPARAHRILAATPELRRIAPVVGVLSPDDLERLAWHDVLDEVLFETTSAAELRLRLAILTARSGERGEAILRLGPLSMNVETYQVAVSGRVLDLTYKEFELLRFLIEHATRVFTRDDLLREVWGYDFYGGTRTVDVHVRRLRAKLGTENERLIATIRGVGYRAVPPERDAANVVPSGRNPELTGG